MNLEVEYHEKRFFSWLNDLLNPARFDFVVAVERKATAFLRALMDLAPEFGCAWKWDDVLSSEALRYLPSNYLSKKNRILVFNEMVHLGGSTKQTIEDIEKNTPGAAVRVKTAAFVVHADFLTKGVWRAQDFRVDPSAASPDFAIERNVSQELYLRYRECLIDSLRSKGALLLDTEHIESTFRFTLPIRRFLGALSTFGLPIQYDVGEGYNFPGVTVESPVVADTQRLLAQLPEGCDFEIKAPLKLRLVRRGPKEFVLIPIWYPAVPLESIRTPGQWLGAPSYVRPALEACPPGRHAELAFHLVSLVTGVELLKSAWAGLLPFVREGVIPDTIKGSAEANSPLGHLRAVYPLLNFEELEAAINSAVAAHTDRALSKLVQSKSGWDSEQRKRVFVIDDATQWDDCRRLLQRIVSEQRERRFSVGDDWFPGEDSKPAQKGFPPLPWEVFMESGAELGISAETRSVIMDILIDNAIFKTTHKTIVRHGREFLVRAYAPDSEFAEEALEKLASGGEELKPRL